MSLTQPEWRLRRAGQLAVPPSRRCGGWGNSGAESLGVTNLLDHYVARAARNQRSPASTRPGSIALLAQSGAMSNIVFNRLQSAGGGVAVSVNTGSELDLTVWDIVAALANDERITCFAVIIEHIKNPGSFVSAA